MIPNIFLWWDLCGVLSLMVCFLVKFHIQEPCAITAGRIYSSYTLHFKDIKRTLAGENRIRSIANACHPNAIRR